MSDPVRDTTVAPDVTATRRPPARGRGQVRALLGATPPPPAAAGDDAFEPALRFVMSQEGEPGSTFDMALSEGAGLTDIARKEYERRHPGDPYQLGQDPKEYHRKIWRDIWQQSGAARLPRQLALVHYDAAVNHGPSIARRMLTESGGDPERYIQLREAFYPRIPDVGHPGGGGPGGREGGLVQNPGWLKKRMPALRAAIGSSPVQPLLNRGSTRVPRGTAGGA